jgi:hypothetical protein
LHGSSFKYFLRSIIPIPPFSEYFFTCHREVFLCDCFIIPKWRELMRKELSPFTCISHMVDDFSAKCLIFLHRVGCVEDAVFLVF